MKIAQKHTNVQKISFTDLSGGLNLSKNGEAIADNELQQAENVEYDFLNGQITTVPGLVASATATSLITSMFYFPVNNTFIYTTSGTMYATNLTTASVVGALTGGEVPYYELFNDKVIIASGGNLQTWDGTTLTAITVTNPIASANVVPYICKERAGRLVIIDKAHDYLFYSGVGDETNWTFDTTASNAKYIEVGYQDGCYITAATFLSSDIVIHKNNAQGTKQRIFKLNGEYSDWVVTLVAESEGAISRFSSVGALNDVYYLGISGFKSLSTVTEYGSIKAKDVGKNLNTFFIQNQVTADARMYHVPVKNQIWIKLQNDYYIYLYHYTTNAFTIRKFYTGQLNGVVCVNNSIYCAIGTKILNLSTSVYTEDGTSYPSTIKLKRFTSQSDYLVLRAFINGQVLGVGSGVITIGKYPLNIVLMDIGVYIYNNTTLIYGNTDLIWQDDTLKTALWMNHRTDAMEVTINLTSGGLSIRNIDLLVTEV